MESLASGLAYLVGEFCRILADLLRGQSIGLADSVRLQALILATAALVVLPLVAGAVPHAMRRNRRES